MYYDLEKQYLKILESIKKCGGFPSRYSMLDINLISLWWKLTV